MQLTIFSCSPQANAKSASAFISEAFKIGFTSNHENTATIYFLRNRDQWRTYKDVFAKSEQVLFVLPLYVDCIPGLLMEFLEYIEDWKQTEEASTNKKLSFILQSGFPEARQMRVCERFLEQLPSYLGCEYAGTLLKGGMFGAAYAMGEKSKTKVGNAYMEFGKQFAKTAGFEKEAATVFAQPECFDQKTIRIMKLMMPLSRMVWNKLAKQNGAVEKLSTKPYNV